MLDTAKRKEMLGKMILVRAFEEKLEELYQRKAMFGSTHSYRGQEAIAVGVCSALQSTDLIASYHRGTGHLIAKGADLYKLLCECMGRADGYSQGRGGKMHMGDMEFGFLGNTGTVGTVASRDRCALPTLAGPHLPTDRRDRVTDPKACHPPCTSSLLRVASPGRPCAASREASVKPIPTPSPQSASE